MCTVIIVIRSSFIVELDYHRLASYLLLALLLDSFFLSSSSSSIIINNTELYVGVNTKNKYIINSTITNDNDNK